MAPMPVPPESGGDDDVRARPQGLRLSDAEGIAADRLDGAAEGSLQEALAVAEADKAGYAAPHPADGIGAVGEGYASGPLVRLIDERSADGSRPRTRKPLDAFSPMPAPPVLDVGIALATPARSARPQPLFAPESDGAPASVGSKDWPSENWPSADRPSADWHGFAGDGRPGPSALAAPMHLPEAGPVHGMEPLTSALDAAVRLAADANVAAEALDALRRMLEHKQQLDRRLPQPAGPAPTPADYGAGSDGSVPDASLPPLPLPLYAEADVGGDAAPMSLPPRRRPPPERRGFDVRGFMAGFALSWAFGVVLYFFMTAG